MSAENGFDALQTKPSHSNADADSLEANVNVLDVNEMRVKCSICRLYFRKHHLPAHMSAVHKQRVFECDKCKKRFYNTVTYYRHRKNVHGGQSTFTKYENGKIIPLMTQNHGNVQRKKCTICGVYFAKDYLWTHTLADHKRRVFNCDECKKRFVHSSAYCRHRKKGAQRPLYIYQIRRR